MSEPGNSIQSTDFVPLSGESARPGENDRPGENHVELQVRERLQASAYSTVRSVVCRFRDGQLTLEGNVPNYFSLQAAIHLALTTIREIGCHDVRLHNEIRVVRAVSDAAGNSSDSSASSPTQLNKRFVAPNRPR